MPRSALSGMRHEMLARRHKMVDGASSEVTYPQVQKALQRLLRQLDESGLSKLIVEMVLLGSVESGWKPNDNDQLFEWLAVAGLRACSTFFVTIASFQPLGSMWLRSKSAMTLVSGSFKAPAVMSAR
jgi:hypothetical protein